MPLIDERVEVRKLEVLAGLKLKGMRYVGASWADVLERVAEDNKCVEVNLLDHSRRDIQVKLSNVITCSSSKQEPTSYACDISHC